MNIELNSKTKDFMIKTSSEKISSIVLLKQSLIVKEVKNWSDILLSSLFNVSNVGKQDTRLPTG